MLSVLGKPRQKLTDLEESLKEQIDVVSIAPGEKAKEIARWLRWADADYIASRLLFLIDHIIQATTLSTTVIEKYLKAICCVYDIKVPKGWKGHDVVEIYSIIKASSSVNTLALKEDYLKLLKKAYRARYPDELESGFCIALSTAKMLSQLDRSVLEITRRFQDKSVDQRFAKGLHLGFQESEKRFLDENIAVDPSISAAFFAKPSWCLEIRRYSDAMSERLYRVSSVKDDLVFPDCVMDVNAKSDDAWKPVFTPIDGPLPENA